MTPAASASSCLGVDVVHDGEPHKQAEDGIVRDRAEWNDK